ncbi:MAG: heme-binding protein [Polyangiaceae bacterium]
MASLELTPASIDPVLPTPAARQSRRIRALEQTSLVVPLAALGIGAYLALRGEGRTRRVGLATLGGSLGAVLTRWQLARWVTEKTRYQVELSDGDFEVRHYAARVQAETVIDAAPWRLSLSGGFHRLAGYIFGDNAAHDKIAMTAPVTVTLGAVDRSTRTVAFKMPDRMTMESLPEPNDRRITLRRVPPRRLAVLTFSGRYGVELPNRKRMELLTRVRNARLLPIGDVTFAGYDAPWTLSFLRRNEVMVEVSSLPTTPTT